MGFDSEEVIVEKDISYQSEWTHFEGLLSLKWNHQTILESLTYKIKKGELKGGQYLWNTNVQFQRLFFPSRWMEKHFGMKRLSGIKRRVKYFFFN